MYYCGFQYTFGNNGKIFAFVPVGIFLMFVAMFNLASTADEYLSPALETMTLKFKLSDSLAGVTLLAFGNGAPDVFSAIAGAKDSNSDGVLNATKSVSIVVGGTFFISTVVMFLSTRASNLNEDPNGTPHRSIKVTPRFFIRDVVFYIITCVYMLTIQLGVGYFNIGLAIGLLLIYGIYVIVVLVQSKGGNSEDDIEEREDNAKANEFHHMVSFQKKNTKRHIIEEENLDEIATKVTR
jgi:sodium/potassium/calcium exchanger 6